MSSSTDTPTVLWTDDSTEYTTSSSERHDINLTKSGDYTFTSTLVISSIVISDNELSFTCIFASGEDTITSTAALVVVIGN